MNDFAGQECRVGIDRVNANGWINGNKDVRATWQ